MSGSPLQLIILLLALGACRAVRTGINGEVSAFHDANNSEAANAVQIEAELKQMMRKAGEKCPCDNWFASASAGECCQRTDSGSLNWKEGESATCAPREDGCSRFCNNSWNCPKVEHANDKENLFDYLKGKLADGLNFEDGLLAKASWGIQMKSTSEKKALIAASGIHQLHPVGNWRGATGDKTQSRVDAILQSKAVIFANNNTLSEHLINTVETLAPMRSVTPFVAFNFPFCSVTQVLLEGNGRIKALKMAQEQDPELKDMKLEASILGGMDATQMREGFQLIMELWNQYVNQIEKMDPETEAARIKEYRTFRVGVYKCAGEQGWFKEKTNCDIVDSNGTKVSDVPFGEFFGADLLQVRGGKDYEYRMCGVKDAYVLSPKKGVIESFCDKCVDKHVIF